MADLRASLPSELLCASDVGFPFNRVSGSQSPLELFALSIFRVEFPIQRNQLKGERYWQRKLEF